MIDHEIMNELEGDAWLEITTTNRDLPSWRLRVGVLFAGPCCVSLLAGFRRGCTRRGAGTAAGGAPTFAQCRNREKTGEGGLIT